MRPAPLGTVGGGDGRHPTMLIWLGKQMLGQRDRPDPAGDAGPLLVRVEYLDRAAPVAGDGRRAGAPV